MWFSKPGWAAVFAALAVVVAAVPVLAAGTEVKPTEDLLLPPRSLEAQGDWLPDAKAIEGGLAEAELEEAKRKRLLESPEAATERTLSRNVFAELDAAAAEALLRSRFGAQLQKLNQDPARYLSGADAVRPLGETAAAVLEGGDRTLFDAGIPVEAKDEQGDLRPVDVSLESTPDGFATRNATTNVEIGDFAGEPVELEEPGVSIAQTGVRTESSSRRFGEHNVFQFETQTDTDTLISPTAGGVEIFHLLRSEQSPESFDYDLDVPEGAEIRAYGGGALVEKDGKRVAVVPPPKAVDAQGTNVPVSLVVEGESLRLETGHRSRDYAYPILVDPILDVWNWIEGHGVDGLTNGAWQWASNPYGLIYLGTGDPCYYTCWGRGLYLTAPARNYGANIYSHWVYSAPNAYSYVENVNLAIFVRDEHGCSSSPAGPYNQPHDYVGYVDNNGNWIGTPWKNSSKNLQSLLGGWGRAYVVGAGTGPGINIPCWRDFYAGVAGVWLNDWDNPALNWVSGVPSGWFGADTPITVTANASDAGLGVQFVTITQEGMGVIAQERPGNCTGLYNARCPTNHSSQFGFTALSLGEGIRTLYASAQDPTGKGSPSHQFQTMVDRSEPHVTLDGQLAQVTEADEGEQQAAEEVETLRLPVYNLKIDASDGNPAGEPKDRRSGVKDIRILLDGDERQVPWTSQGCAGPHYSCPMNVTYHLALTDIDAGEHTLKVLVVDQVGNERERNIEFEYFPATGMSEDYMLHHFPLAADETEPDPEGSLVPPELAVNVMNGNLVYREKDIDIEGSALDLEVERYYNSQLPDSENTEWGAGWTLAQTPELEPEAGPSPTEGELLDSSGALAEEVTLPTELGEEEFDSTLRATLTKDAEGYELRDETGESAATIAFDEAGRTQELRTEGDTKIDFTYDGNELSEIAVHDPGSAGGPQEEPEELEGEDPQVPAPELSSDGGFGSAGASSGQFDSPSRIAVGPNGDLWVTDSDNHRVQRFNQNGEYLDEFGEGGSGNGKFWEPIGIDIDSAGNVYVVDAGNNRVQKFNDEGEYLDQFGAEGTGNGQFGYPFGIAVGEEGDVYVADSGNHRVQRFDADGKFLASFGEAGTGDGRLDFPFDIAVDPAGDVLVADSFHHRVQKFSPDGEYLDQFGEGGDGEGQFWLPSGIDVGPDGRIWVTDAWNDRVQVFDFAGEFLSEFGSGGEGEAELYLPYGVALSASGQRAWIADNGNDRIRSWVVAQLGPEELGSVPEDDPAVEIAVSGGLVESVEGEAAGEHTYEHEGDLLIAHEGPDGKVAYEYDPEQRLTKVTLPDGTWAEIEYEEIAGRVESVTVDPAGEESAKTTEFEYTDAAGPEEARRATVIPEGARRTFYDIGADGSILKWRNAEEPPKLNLAGTLYDNREVDGKLDAGDHLLEAQAFSAEGIVSIEVIVNGNILVDELHCDPEEPVSECEDQKNPWVMETAANTPGHLAVEVIATDRAGQSASERFWVDVPEPPPPLAPGTPVPPKFGEIAKFRAEYGLEIVFPVADEIELNERIFDLITAWWNPQTPAGEVARASYERWGVPLRPADVAELEYREWFYEVNAEKIDQWVEATSPATYAGYYLDHAAGGIMRIGFLGDQAAQLANLESSLSLVGGSRLNVYPTSPTVSYLSVRATAESVMDAIESNPTLADLVIGVEEDESGRTVRVGTEHVAQVEGIVDQTLGSDAPVTVEFEPLDGGPLSGRFRNSGRMRAGDAIFTKRYTADYPAVHKGNSMCTAGFGAKDKAGEQAGQTLWRLFVLTAGHCSGLNPYEKVANRSTDSKSKNESTWREVGQVRRDAFHRLPLSTDAEAIRVEGGGIIPREIFGWNGTPIPVKGPGKVRKDKDWVCFSGARRQVPQCGPVVHRSTFWHNEEDGFARGGYWVKFKQPALPGDSGAPVWAAGSRRSIGLVTGRRSGGMETLVEPLLHPPNMAPEHVVGILHNPHLAPLSITLGG